MECLDFEYLPILVVSARDQNSAEALIAEVIEKDALEECSGGNNTKICVWKLVNKYYTASVRLHTLLDGQELESQLIDFIEAHLIYMSEDECSVTTADAILTRRMRSVPAARAHVRVVAADAAEPAAALVAACAAARVELVPLRQPPEPHEPPEPGDECGVARVRSAFHAHVWSGLMRRGFDDSTESNREGATDSSDDDDEWSDWCSGPGSGTPADGERAFAAALASLPGAAAAARLAAGAGSREERLARAEELVTAFCRALGTPLE